MERGMNKIKKIYPIRKIDELKSGQWYVWEADAELEDGSIIAGFVEADYGANLIEETSFEPEE
jgi:hypothetical protein